MSTTPSAAQPKQATQAPATPRAARLLGTIISGRYRLEAIISESLTGTLYRAEHTHMHKRIAVKLLHPDAASRPAVLARFEREAIAGAHVDHPNVALAKDFGTLDDGSRFLVMEYLEGGTLRAAMTEQGALPIERALRVARHIALALDAAHAIGIVHRALMPENVHLIERGGERDVVKLVDFGSAMLPHALIPPREESRDAADRIATPFDPVPTMAAYAAPELAAGKEVDGRADLFALGIVLWEMLVGKRPAIERGAPLPTLTGVRAVPAAVDALVRQLLAERPEERTARAIDVAEVLETTIASMSGGRRSQASLPALENAALGATVFSTAEPPVTEKVSPYVPLSLRKPQSLPEKAKTHLGRAMTSLQNNAPGWFTELPRPIRFGLIGASAVIAIIVVAIALRPAGVEDQLAVAAGATQSTVSKTSGGARPSGTTARFDDPGFIDPDRATIDDRADADGHALRDRFMREVGSRRLNDAVTTLEYLLRVDDKAPEDRDVREAVVKLSQRITQVNGAAPDRYFDLVARKMGSIGPDILFELMTTKGGSDAADRAGKLMKDDDVRGLGTPALRVAYELKTARSCEVRVALLDRVKNDGDRRSLQPLLQMNECGRRSSGDCCLRDDPRLRDAMQALKERGVRWQ
jgi:serine/threonine-protein kinase